jgi:ABC-type Fe3+ transport system permease subunit
MKRLEELPDLPPAVPFLLVALVVTVWLALRIRLLRRRKARRETGEPEVREWGWLRAFAAKTWAVPTLVLVALLLVAAIVASFLA